MKIKAAKLTMPVLIILLGHIGCGNSTGGPDGGDSERSLRCDTPSEWFSKAESSVYSVMVRIPLDQPPESFVDVLVGTAFAIDHRTLATNAHIVEGVYDYFAAYEVPEVIARQSGGELEFRVIGWAVHSRAALINPIQDDPHDPDVAVLKVDDDMPSSVELADTGMISAMQIGDVLDLAGFPGDVYLLNPFAVHARATLLDGSISNLFDYAGNGVPDISEADVFLHSIPTSAGTSGSPIAHCGKVVAINYAGTTDLNSDNNLGVNVNALRELVDDIASYSISVTTMIDVFEAATVSDCPAVCDYCNLETEDEHNCPTQWYNDGECDCGCQFEDIDCPPTGAQPRLFQ